MTRPSLKSRFGEQIRAFVGYKNSLGFPYNESIRILGRFDDFCVERFPEKDCLDCELALAWLEKRDTENTAGHRNRIMVMKNKHRIKQRLSLLLAGALTFTNVGAALPAFAEDAPATPETASAATTETAEANVPTPNLSQITENLYDDLPDAPTGSYLGSMGLPVATGETKIGISAWVSDLYDGVDAHMDADALNADENTVTIGKTPGTDYAIVPLLAQVEYPADGAVSEIILPDGVELLSYLSTDYEPIPADEQEQAEILHQTYSEQSAAAIGLYVKASADFTAQLVYTDSDGSSQSKSIHVQISEDAAPTQMYADTGDDGIAAYAAGPTPPYATGKITSIAKEGGTWLIWFNGQEAYCCSHGLNGQPKGCPTYSFSHVSRLEPGQYTPGKPTLSTPLKPSRQLSAAPSRQCTLGGIAPVSFVMRSYMLCVA